MLKEKIGSDFYDPPGFVYDTDDELQLRIYPNLDV